MSENTLISIIVPVYNVEKYLDECIESLTAQTHKNIEIVLVDDASPDNSGKKCDEWAKRDSRIVVVHKYENQGLNMARSTGLSASTGDWVSFVDSDDIVNERYIDDLLSVALSTDTDIAVARNCKFESKNDIASIDNTNDGTLVIKNKSDIMRYAFVESPDPSVYMIITCCKLFKRSVIEGIDWEFSNARANEDELEAIQYFSNQKHGVVVLKKVLYYYRDNPGSITNKPYTNQYRGEELTRFEWLEKLYETATTYFGKNKYADELLYHNVMLNLLFFNKDISKGVFNDRDYRVFYENFYPKIAQYKKVSNKYPLRYEEKRTFDILKDTNNLFAVWTSDRNIIDELRQSVRGSQSQCETLQQQVSDLQQELTDIKNSRLWKIHDKYRAYIKKR